MLNQVPLPPPNPIGSTLLEALSQPPASYANTRWDVKLRIPPHVLCFIPLFNHRIRADPFLSSLSFNHRINNLKILNAVAFLNAMSDYPTSIQQRHGNDGLTTCDQLTKKVLRTWVCSDASSSLVAPTEKIKWMILCKAPSHSIRHQGLHIHFPVDRWYSKKIWINDEDNNPLLHLFFSFLFFSSFNNPFLFEAYNRSFALTEWYMTRRSNKIWSCLVIYLEH